MTLEFAKNRIVALRRYIDTIYDRDMDNGRKYLIYKSSFELLQHWRKVFRILRFQQTGRTAIPQSKRYYVCPGCRTSNYSNAVTEDHKKSVNFCILCQKIIRPVEFIPSDPQA